MVSKKNYFHPENLGKMNPFWRAYVSKGLVQPPTSFQRWWGCCRCFRVFLVSLWIPRHPSHPPIIPGEDRCLEPLKSRTSGDVWGVSNTHSQGIWMFRELALQPFIFVLQHPYPAGLHCRFLVPLSGSGSNWVYLGRGDGRHRVLDTGSEPPIWAGIWWCCIHWIFWGILPGLELMFGIWADSMQPLTCAYVSKTSCGLKRPVLGLIYSSRCILVAFHVHVDSSSRRNWILSIGFFLRVGAYRRSTVEILTNTTTSGTYLRKHL